jgi:hypothetical protein
MLAGMAKRTTTSIPVSDQLRRLIKTCGMTRYRLARETGIDAATLCRFAAGECGLSMKALDRLGHVLELKIESQRKNKETKG